MGEETVIPVGAWDMEIDIPGASCETVYIRCDHTGSLFTVDGTIGGVDVLMEDVWSDAVSGIPRVSTGTITVSGGDAECTITC
jgi:hypothetical protein